MPKTETAGHATERVKLQTSPVALVRFFHVKTYGDGTDYRFSRDFVSGAIVNPSTAPWGAIMQIGGNTQVIEPEMGRSSIGSFTVQVLDVVGEFLKYLSSPALTLNGAHNSAVTTINVNQDPSGYPAFGTIEITTATVIERVRYRKSVV